MLKLQKKVIYHFKIQNLIKLLLDNLKLKVKVNKNSNNLNSKDIL